MFFQTKITIVNKFPELLGLANKAAFRNLGHAAASIRKKARSAIQKLPQPAPAGWPPFTKRGLLKRAILYRVSKNKKRAIIGPSFILGGRHGMAHEFGGRYKKQNYPERAFMYPSLVDKVPQFAGNWEGSIGG